MLLQHIGEMGPAKRIHDAILKVLAMGDEHRTRDIGGTGSTTDFTVAVCDILRKGTRADD
jgi:isocitrate/isopropylmalate dehydrogenase